LYGFMEEGERTLFRHLISISGIGPNTARMVLSSLPPEELRHTIIRGDVALLKAIKGIGPKSAQRIVIELQDVLKKTSAEDLPELAGRSRATEEALAAMVMLGFGRPAVEKAISRILRENKEELTVEELIKHALKMI
nr:Holliday junction branch migration protein RuvA [Bacteroidota bacterium]